MCTVKLKKIIGVYFSGAVETKDVRYNFKKLKLKKVVNFCLKNGYAFKYRYNNNRLIKNKNYIEIISECDNVDKITQKLNNWK